MRNFLLILALIVCALAKAQNVGVGITIPTAKLHVNGSMKLEGLNLFELGAGIAGKELNAGKIGYNAFGTNALAFVGAGTSTLNRAVYFFAEGGTTFTGPINIGGTVQVNGNPGTAGQVLTSNGTSDPTWKNTAFANNTRFSASILGPGYNTALIYSTTYNTNTTDVTIGANSITINKTGLYHLDGFFAFTAGYTGTFTQSQAPWISIFFNVGGDTYYGAYQQDMTERIYYSAGFNKFFFFQTKFNFDVYITAGQVLTLSRLFAGQPTPANFSNIGVLSGYLISE